MKARILGLVLALCFGASAAQSASVDSNNVDAVKYARGAQWNAKGSEASSTTYKLVARDGRDISGRNPAYIDIGGTVRKVTASDALTQAACATNWGTSGTHNVYLYAGWAATTGVKLCVSDVANKTTVGATAVGSTGHVACSTSLGSTSAPIRQIGQADLNCTGPVIGTYAEDAQGVTGKQTLNVKAAGSASSATAAAALVYTIQGLEVGDRCTATPVSLGTGPNYIKFAAVTANTLTVTVDTAQSGGATVINYVCF